jgi:lysozyme family protein
MMPSNFDFAFDYIVGNEGAYSNDAADTGGETFWGISVPARRDHRCHDHPQGIRDEAFKASGGKELAKHIYRLDYWRFDGIRDPRLAAKLFDIVVNVGDPIRLIQRAFGVAADGKYGEQTEAAIQRVPTEQAIERLCLAVGDKYCSIVQADTYARMRKFGISETEIAKAQITFLKGWTRRAIRRPAIVVKGV